MRISPRSCGDLLRHTPLSWARLAAATALRTSSRSATATVAQGSSVAGLMVGAVLPPLAASHCPLMNRPNSFIANFLLSALVGGGKLVVSRRESQATIEV